MEERCVFNSHRGGIKVDSEKKLAEFATRKIYIEKEVAVITSDIQEKQSQLVQLNKEYLIIQGKMEILEELKREADVSSKTESTD